MKQSIDGAYHNNNQSQPNDNNQQVDQTDQFVFDSDNNKAQPENDKVNFIKEYNDKPEIKKPAFTNKIFRLAILVITLLVFLTGSAMFSNYVLGSEKTNDLNTTLGKLNIWQQLSSFISNSDNDVEKERRDRINLLLMGMGGPNHDGPFLTDTIILASLQPSTGKVAMVSIPRDLYVAYNEQRFIKINELYTIGINNEVEEPASLASEIIGNNLGITIDYYVVVDFQGFIEIIDILGGVNVNVKRSFVDEQYPAPNYEYQTVAFTEGWQEMDGDTALKFARSRHGNNGEGSDFARGLRQQKILFAIKEKVLDYNTIFNPYRLNKLYNLFTEYISTNIDIKEALELNSYVSDLDFNNILRFTLDDSPTGLLRAEINNIGAYVLVPKNGYNSLQNFFQNIFNYEQTAAEKADIEVQNGTSLPGLAYNITQQLRKYNLTVAKFTNAAAQDYQRTIIYETQPDKYPKTLSLLKEILETDLVSRSLPSHLQPTDPAEEINDFIIILGQDQGYLEQINQIQ